MDMSRLMKKLIVLNDVSLLAVRLNRPKDDLVLGHMRDALNSEIPPGFEMHVDAAMLASETNQGDSFDYSDAMSSHPKDRSSSYTASAHMEIMELLEEWEEPELQGDDEEVRWLVDEPTHVLGTLLTLVPSGDYSAVYPSIPSCA